MRSKHYIIFLLALVCYILKLIYFLCLSPSLLLVNFVANLISMFALLYKRNEFPLNFYLLGAFTLFNSLSLGILISQYDAMVVVQAFCLTTVIVVALTLYTFNTKRDLSFMGGTLSTLLLVSVVGGFMHVSLELSEFNSFK